MIAYRRPFGSAPRGKRGWEVPVCNLYATRAACLAKNFADEMALTVADRAVQTLGGHGYIRDYPVEMWLRNARGFAVMEGIAIV